MYKVYLLEIKTINLEKYTNAYTNHVNPPNDEQMVIDSRQEFFVEKKRLIEKIKKNLK
jgi:hypothetical protein